MKAREKFGADAWAAQALALADWMTDNLGATTTVEIPVSVECR